MKEIPDSLTERKGGYRQANSAYGYPQARPTSTNITYHIPEPIKAAPQYNIPEFRKGDMVQHTAFGRGMVLSVMKMGGDALLEIAFDEIGTKRLMAKTASSHMKHL